MPRVFAITAANAAVKLDQVGHGEAAFTVSNTTKRPLRGRAKAIPLESTKTSWLSVAGESERDFGPDATHQFTVQIVVPPGTPPGRYSFNIVVASTENPDEEYAEGPSVAFESTAAEVRKKPFPWWILVVVGAVILVGIIAVLLLMRQPSPPRQATPIRASVIPLTNAASEATWTNDDGQLLKFGAEIPTGFAVWKDKATLEDGSTHERVLETHPRWVAYGTIRGSFTLSSPIEKGDHFRSQVGFLQGAKDGEVDFVVMANDRGVSSLGSAPNYIHAGMFQQAAPRPQILEQVLDSGADGILRTIDADLSPIAGQSQIVLMVRARASANYDWAVWVNPRIERRGESS